MNPLKIMSCFASRLPRGDAARAVRLGTFLFALALVLAAGRTARAAEPLPADLPRFDDAMVLRVRHPEITSRGDFKEWSEKNSIGPWHETAPADGAQSVLIQDVAGDRLFAALLVDGRHVQRAAAIDLQPVAKTRKQVLFMATEQKIERRHIISSRPTVKWLPDGKVELGWELGVVKEPAIDLLRLKDGRLEMLKTIPKVHAPQGGAAMMAPKAVAPAAPPPPAAPPAAADDLADNELHHLAAFAAEAKAWTAGATTVREKAQRISDAMKAGFRYDSTIQNIAEFTWADYLTRDQNERGGICDEWVVCGISYLRSLGIPARLKFLSWTENGKPYAHAALEYRDGETWRHLDALWEAHDDPGVYRRKGVTNVGVMDADHPSDARSTVPSWGVPDVTGDGKLNPYADFVLVPAYPGNARPGYSN